MADETSILDGLSLLVLEDDPDTLDMLTTFLNYCGAAVVPSRSADVGLECLPRHHFDAIVTDLTVLRMGAGNFLQQVRGAPGYASVPVIAISGWVKQQASELDPGFTEYLLKPVELDAVTATILRLVRPAPVAN
jgi:CheY-like chemotaxis protein